MKCVIYVRVSTDEQARHGYSIAAQIEKLEAYCISQGWEMVKQFIDDGYSAKDLNRPQFKEMMNIVKKGGIDVVLVYRLDRLTRSVVDLYSILQELDKYDCKFKSATEVYDTTNAMGRLFITLVAAIAQWERENTAERVRMGMEKKIKLGLWKGGTPPYGYKIVDKQLVVNENEVGVVKEVFELSKTLGFYTIAKQLSTKGYQTRKGSDWHVDSVRDIANNPVYAGYLTFSESLKEYKKPPREQNLYEGNHDKIISRDEFWALQDILDKRRKFGGKRETSNYYFSSILKCARCGHSMSGHKSGDKKTYRCSGKKAGKNCTSHIILEDNLVKTVFAQWDELIGDFKSSEGKSEYSTELLSTLENDLASVQKLMKKKKTMYENDVIDIDELIRETEKLREKEKELQREIKNIQQNNSRNNEDLKSIIRNIDSLWLHANDYERKQLMTMVFEQLVIDTKDEYHSTKHAREIIIVSAK
ncbi:recombinase family protein [Lysinibacillus capsici]|uniref:recombinase family protein n=1 Tax=Lysinibacillus capsici TaxID=2115968 RepID=UPI002FDD9894